MNRPFAAICYILNYVIAIAFPNEQKPGTREQQAVRKTFSIGFLKLHYTGMLFLMFQM